MNKLKLSFTLVFLSFFLVGATCSKVPVTSSVTTEQKDIENKKKEAEETLDKIDKKNELQKVQAATFAQGVNYSLNQITNPPVEVKTAITLNDRIMSILGSPKMDETKKMKEIVDLLNSKVEDEKNKGESLLNSKDKEITKLQKEKAKLQEEYDNQIFELTEQAKLAAESADAKQQTIDSMGGWFGLNAVFWGLKKFFFTSLTFIVVFAILFILLRVLSAVNPIAGAAFAIFNMFGSLVVSGIKTLTPKAFELTHLVPLEQKEKFKAPLIKIVDVIQEAKDKLRDNPERVFSVKDLLDKFDREFDQKEKELINEILKELNWKK